MKTDLELLAQILAFEKGKSTDQSTALDIARASKAKSDFNGVFNATLLAFVLPGLCGVMSGYDSISQVGLSFTPPTAVC